MIDLNTRPVKQCVTAWSVTLNAQRTVGEGGFSSGISFLLHPRTVMKMDRAGRDLFRGAGEGICIYSSIVSQHAQNQQHFSVHYTHNKLMSRADGCELVYGAVVHPVCVCAYWLFYKFSTGFRMLTG